MNQQKNVLRLYGGIVFCHKKFNGVLIHARTGWTLKHKEAGHKQSNLWFHVYEHQSRQIYSDKK